MRPGTGTVTSTDNSDADSDVGAASAGLLLVFSAGKPAAAAIPVGDQPLQIGRDSDALGGERDVRMSRRHAEIRQQEQKFWVTDLESRNGTTVDGQPARVYSSQEAKLVIGAGESLFLPQPDLRKFQRYGIEVIKERVLGPRSLAVMQEVARIASTSSVLHITGESGAGKEGIARAFHSASAPPGSPLITVNCATIQEGIAERLLFGARRGSYSGADTDTQGYVQAADGGTLFLDEIAELTDGVQAKLLRLLENREVTPVGATLPRPVNLRFCTATHQDLRTLVAARRLRQDLFFRISSPYVELPPLRQRREEIPWLLAMEVQRAAPDLLLRASLVEACLLRPWPGNVRELLNAARSAIHHARSRGSTQLELQDLGETAGLTFTVLAAAPVAELPTRPRPTARPERIVLEEALRRAQGNVTAAARDMGLHRNQLRRWIASYGIVIPVTMK